MLGNLNFRCLDLYTGVIRYQEGHNFCCFFIVNYMDDAEYIKKHALELLVAGCRDFHFYGKHAQLWENIFDSVDIYRTSDEDDWAMTCGGSSIENFVDELSLAIHTRPIVPFDIYLIYDDAIAKNEILALLEQSDKER